IFEPRVPHIADDSHDLPAHPVGPAPRSELQTVPDGAALRPELPDGRSAGQNDVWRVTMVAGLKPSTLLYRDAHGAEIIRRCHPHLRRVLVPWLERWFAFDREAAAEAPTGEWQAEDRRG